MERRGHGDGTIRESTNGLYQARGYLEGKRRSFYGKTKKEALGKLRDAQHQAAAGRLAPTKGQTTAAYLESWLADVEHRVRPKTLAAYRLNVNRLTPHIGKVKLTELKPAHVQAAYTKLLAAGLSERSVQQAATVLHKALEDAADLDLIPRNPADRAKAPRPKRTERPTLTGEQLMLLFEGTTGDRFAALWVVLGTTGLRIGEALGLTWADVDLDAGTLAVHRALQRIPRKGLQRVEPKSKSGERAVPLTSIAVEALRAHRDRQTFEARQAKEAGLWTDSGLVFTSEVGTGLDYGRVAKHWKATLTRLDLPMARMHDLRHTFVTLLAEQGEHPDVVRRLVGHATIGITLQAYTHTSDRLQRDAVGRLEASLRRKQE